MGTSEEQQQPPATPATQPPTGDPAEPTPDREYRAAELAEAAGITTRTLRFYRERKLLPPPRREGRIAWYDDHHLNRLHTIAALLERGHTLGGIAELLAAFEKGRDSRSAAELLGLTEAHTPRFSEETPVRLTPEDLASHFPGEDTPENLSAALDLGYLSVEGDEIVHVSRRLLDASAALVREGIPLADVLSTGAHVRAQVETIAELFAELLKENLLGDNAATDAVLEAVDRLRPHAKQVVEAELSMALDRKVRSEVETWLAERT
ncbi:MerR family transcriptional regulator [Streptomyces alkaliterrae]|uniref:MerR family transcriptional regulator n=1 Tax=Streptomyces alkaliterrae TaxID=2213162 RepID=A0A5P0YS96_9ACTN|nr:MerR family transcriptional regulator [Streptomyces alkaliterrae]MBB1262030.1 MerR family transcriptional regulator [Streptomyces alkaliterrae]MQS03201.1 MerR family transcriptional regulator [Streptomyces alkaliterrae]